VVLFSHINFIFNTYTPRLWCLRHGKLQCVKDSVWLMVYEGGPKNKENFFSGGERGDTSICSHMVHVG